MIFSLRNLSAQSVASTPNPWEYTGAKRPEFPTKDEFRAWCKRPATQHYFFSAYEGINGSARINKENPPYRMHGLVADYDSSVDADIDGAIARNCPAEFRPAWSSRTFSGGARLLWEFEAPVFTYTPAALKDFLGRLRKELKLDKILAGFDAGVYSKPDQLFELGTDWKRVSDVRIPTATLLLWIYESGNKVKWGGVEIPLDTVKAEIDRQFPGRWQGDFVEGARGRRFWDPTADDDTAAVVRASGMTAFTGDRPFITWTEILGPAFTRGFEANRIAVATEQVYFDGREYWRQEAGEWVRMGLESLQLHLRVAAGLSRDPGKLTHSEVDKATYHIQCKNRIVAAVPFVHRKKGLHREPDGLYLNTSNVEVCKPVGDSVEWAEGFPWLAGLLDGYFSTPDQLPLFLAWLQRFYSTAHDDHMEPGQAVFIAGPVEQGKTLFATRVVGGMMGGSADVTSYMLGQTAWNSSLFERAVWNIDDSAPGKDPRAHSIFSANIKKHVANQAFDLQKKFKDAARVNWTGRTIVTLNDDQESLNMLPEMDLSLEDKVSFFRTANRKYDFSGCEAKIAAELPFFCRWLLDWEAPESTKGSPRFGIKEYHEPSLLAAAKERGRVHEFRELLEAYLFEYFKTSTDDSWSGSATQLFSEMSSTPTTQHLVKRTSAPAIGRGLTTLAGREPDLISYKTVRGVKTWVVGRELVGES